MFVQTHSYVCSKVKVSAVNKSFISHCSLVEPILVDGSKTLTSKFRKKQRRWVENNCPKEPN